MSNSLKKLGARRVRVFVGEVLHSATFVQIEGREATCCASISEISWRTLDLYTLAFDLCEDDELRFLIGQARMAIQGELIRRSESRGCSRFPSSRREG